MTPPNPNWQQDFRDLMFGDLKVIKFILDNDPRSYGETFVPVPMWSTILNTFWFSNYDAMTPKERARYYKQIRELGRRLDLADEFRKGQAS